MELLSSCACFLGNLPLSVSFVHRICGNREIALIEKPTGNLTSNTDLQQTCRFSYSCPRWRLHLSWSGFLADQVLLTAFDFPLNIISERDHYRYCPTNNWVSIADQECILYKEENISIRSLIQSINFSNALQKSKHLWQRSRVPWPGVSSPCKSPHLIFQKHKQFTSDMAYSCVKPSFQTESPHKAMSTILLVVNYKPAINAYCL